MDKVFHLVKQSCGFSGKEAHHISPAQTQAFSSLASLAALNATIVLTLASVSPSASRAAGWNTCLQHATAGSSPNTWRISPTTQEEKGQPVSRLRLARTIGWGWIGEPSDSKLVSEVFILHTLGSVGKFEVGTWSLQTGLDQKTESQMLSAMGSGKKHQDSQTLASVF